MNTNDTLIDIIRYTDKSENSDTDNELTFDMTGGRVIGEGGFGCVLKPAIKCDGKERKGDKFITKIQLDSETSYREIEISKLIKKIPLFKKHFAPIVSNCYSKPKVVNMIVKNNNCRFLNENPDEKFAISTIPAIQGDNFKQYIYNQVDNSNLLYTTIHSYVYLLFSIYLLDKHDIIHYDLKSENIMFDIIKKRPIIIDFGLSIHKKDINPEFKGINLRHLSYYFYAYAPDYQLWCLDIHYLSYICNKSTHNVKDKIEDMVKTYVANNSAFQYLSSDFRKQYRELAIKQLNKYADMGVENTVKYLYKYSNTWDNYSLSIMFIRLLKLFKYDNSNQFLTFFEALLCQNVHPIPEKRISIKKTHDIIVNYLNNNTEDTGVFQNIVNALDKDKSDIKKAIKKQMKYDEAVSYKMSMFK